MVLGGGILSGILLVGVEVWKFCNTESRLTVQSQLESHHSMAPKTVLGQALTEG